MTEEITDPPNEEGWMCGAFQPVRPTGWSYRCTEPAGHDGDHRAVVDGETLAVWMPAGVPEEKTR